MNAPGRQATTQPGALITATGPGGGRFAVTIASLQAKGQQRLGARVARVEFDGLLEVEACLRFVSKPFGDVEPANDNGGSGSILPVSNRTVAP